MFITSHNEHVSNQPLSCTSTTLEGHDHFRTPNTVSFKATVTDDNAHQPLHITTPVASACNLSHNVHNGGGEPMSLFGNTQCPRAGVLSSTGSLSWFDSWPTSPQQPYRLSHFAFSVQRWPHRPGGLPAPEIVGLLRGMLSQQSRLCFFAIHPITVPQSLHRPIIRAECSVASYPCR